MLVGDGVCKLFRVVCSLFGSWVCNPLLEQILCRFFLSTNSMGVFGSIRAMIWKLLSQHYEYAAVYEGPEETDIIYEGETRVHLNGWVETENGDRFSPDTVHHIEDRSLIHNVGRRNG